MEPLLQVPLRPVAAASRRQMIGLLVLFSVLGAMWASLFTAMFALDAPVAQLVGVLAGAAVGGWSLYRRRGAPPIVIEAFDNHILLPHRGKTVPVPWARIRACYLATDGTQVSLHIAAHRVWHLDARRLVDPTALRLLHDLIRHKMSPENLGRADQRAKQDLQFYARRAPVTRWAVYLCLLAYAIEMALDATDLPAQLIRMGANVPLLVFEGQWDRLITANLLHAAPWHIFFNLLGLHYLGGLLEKAFRGPVVLALLVLTGVAGQLASAVASVAMLSVGVSASVYGLLGAFAWFNTVRRTAVPSPVLLPPRLWWLVGLSTLGLTLAYDRIDNWAHFGGFAAGILLAAIFDLAPALKRVLAGVSLIALVLGIGVSAQRAMSPQPNPAELLLRLSLSRADTDPVQLNNLAWMVAIAPDATPAALEMALTASARVVKDQPDQTIFRDTYATALFRTGAAQDAIQQELQVLDAARADPSLSGDVPLFATQLLRFLVNSGHFEPTALEFMVQPDGSVLFRAEQAPFRAFLQLQAAGKPLGLVELASASPQGYVRGPKTVTAPGHVLVPLWVKPMADAPPTPALYFWPLVLEVGHLPGSTDAP